MQHQLVTHFQLVYKLLIWTFFDKTPAVRLCRGHATLASCTCGLRAYRPRRWHFRRALPKRLFNTLQHFRIERSANAADYEILFKWNPANWGAIALCLKCLPLWLAVFPHNTRRCNCERYCEQFWNIQRLQLFQVYCVAVEVCEVIIL